MEHRYLARQTLSHLTSEELLVQLRLWIENSRRPPELLQVFCSNEAVTSVIAWPANDENFLWLFEVIMSTLGNCQSGQLHQLESIEKARIWIGRVGAHQV